MSSGIIELNGEEIFCSIVAGGREARYRVAAVLDKLRGWAKRYDDASRVDREGDLAAIGLEMFAWLNERGGWASAWSAGAGDRSLEIVVPGDKSSAETALLDAPWELLGRETGPLALDDVQLFVVARRIGRRETPRAAGFADLQAMFRPATRWLPCHRKHWRGLMLPAAPRAARRRRGCLLPRAWSRGTAGIAGRNRRCGCLVERAWRQSCERGLIEGPLLNGAAGKRLRPTCVRDGRAETPAAQVTIARPPGRGAPPQ
jgi:hypothetical protein